MMIRARRSGARASARNSYVERRTARAPWNRLCYGCAGSARPASGTGSGSARRRGGGSSSAPRRRRPARLDGRAAAQRGLEVFHPPLLRRREQRRVDDLLDPRHRRLPRGAAVLLGAAGGARRGVGGLAALLCRGLLLLALAPLQQRERGVDADALHARSFLGLLVVPQQRLLAGRGRREA